MHILFLFLDGIGLGVNDPEINPFVRAEMPTLRSLLGTQPLVANTAPHHGRFASLFALDPNLGVDGLPQSATGQATLLTGINVPAEIGYHYGPKPNADVRAFLLSDEEGNGKTIFHWLHAKKKSAALISGYPDGYFKGIDSGKRMYSAIPLAVTQAGFPLFGAEDIYEGRALSAGFTGKFWREMLKDDKAPLYTKEEAGAKLVELAMQYDFAFFEYWASDYAGHKQDMDWAVEQLENLDGVLKGMLATMPNDLLVLLTSDHGNMENLSTRRHTDVKVPCLLFGSEENRNNFFQQEPKTLADIAPQIKTFLTQ